MKALRLGGHFLLAVLSCTALASILQTQFNLAQLAALGVAIPGGTRLVVTGQDLLGFAPGFAAIVAVGFLLALPCAALLRRWLGLPAGALNALAGGTAVLTALLSMNALFDLTAVAAARSAAGLTALVLAGATGGWVFARLRRE